MTSDVKLLQNLLDYYSEKNRVIAKNISNIGTENYKRQDVLFKEALNERTNSIIKTTSQKHLGGVQNSPVNNSTFEHVDDQSEDIVSGENNVNIEREMSELAENTLRYKFASREVGDYYRNLQNVIKGGGKI
ncbi:MAG: flagellar basal body rod protein FlgB [Ignavibacteriales bacterium]|nr:flagellar basal body rod protein FlgB [Ignavibacteriales bacterium]